MIRGQVPVEDFIQLPLGEMLAKLPEIHLPGASKAMLVRRRMPTIHCVDGTRLSVQAGELLYSTPRDNKGPYTHVEVGYPSIEPPDTWIPYAENPDAPTKTVYAYIPIEYVYFFIAAHGGIDREATFREFSYDYD